MAERSKDPDESELGRVHFIGAGGAGMSAVARIMLADGVPVSGSDAKDSTSLQALAALGARTVVGQRAENILGEESVPSVDTVVVSTAIREDNPELAAAREAGLNVLHRSAALAATMAGDTVIAVAGTHGKTTTTAMTTVLLREVGRDPSFAIGGDVAALGVNAARGTGEIFVAEADESDGSFLNYAPDVAIVTNVEPDHLDHYGTAEAVTEIFERFAGLLGADGVLIACQDDAGSAGLAARVRDGGPDAPRVLTYGVAATSDLRIDSMSATEFGSTSTLELSLNLTPSALDADSGVVELHLNVPGEHNVRNACAGLLAAVSLGVDPVSAARALATFTGAGRRFELRGAVTVDDGAPVRVFDDYAHHPTEVAAALAAARSVAGSGRVHVIFQPHLFSRTRAFATEFAEALAAADDVVLLDIFPAREDPIPGVTSELIVEAAQASQQSSGRADTPMRVVSDPARAVAEIVRSVRGSDLVLTVGAGDVTTLGAQLVAGLESARTGERDAQEGSER